MAAASGSSCDEAYMETKRKYLSHVHRYYANRKQSVSYPWTLKVVKKIMFLIKDGLALKLSGHPSEHKKYEVMKKYEVIVQDGKEILIRKRKSDGDRIVQIVPAEECFDIIWDAHIKSSHGSREMIMKIIGYKYSVPKTSIEFILAICDWCAFNAYDPRLKARYCRNPRVFHSRGQVSIIDMSDQPDHAFKYILFYLDRFTNYMILRPLMTNSEGEVAAELLKIFLDFGPPQKLEAYSRAFFVNVIGLVTTMMSEEFDIYTMLPLTIPDINPSDVKSMLCNWQLETGTRNWAVGCYIIQWKNNCRLSLDGKSPYFSVFNIKPWHANLNNSNAEEKAAIDVADETTSFLDLEEGHDFQIMSNSVEEKDEQQNIDEEENVDMMEEDDDIIIITEPPNMFAPVPSLSPTKEQSVQTINKSHKPIILQKRSDGVTYSKEDIIKRQQKDVAACKPASGKTGNSSTEAQKQQDPVEKPMANLDDAIASTFINVKTGHTSVKKKCHVCKTIVIKPYKCMKCNRHVHLFCSDRLLQQGISEDVLDVICTSCKLVSSRVENLKRKLSEINP